MKKLFKLFVAWNEARSTLTVEIICLARTNEFYTPLLSDTPSRHRCKPSAIPPTQNVLPFSQTLFVHY